MKSRQFISFMFLLLIFVAWSFSMNQDKPIVKPNGKVYLRFSHSLKRIDGSVITYPESLYAEIWIRSEKTGGQMFVSYDAYPFPVDTAIELTLPPDSLIYRYGVIVRFTGEQIGSEIVWADSAATRYYVFEPPKPPMACDWVKCSGRK